MEETLTTALRHVICSEGNVENLHQKMGGAVAETWSFDFVCPDRRYEFILRMSRNEDPENRIGIHKVTEAKVQKAAYESGVPTPNVRLILDGSEGIGTGYVMDRFQGESIPQKILRNKEFASACSAMTLQCGHILCRIHSINISCLPHLEELTPKLQIDRYRAKYDALGEYHPVFEVAFRWLEKNLPETGSLCLVHGDFRNGNFIVDQSGIRAVLDWELTHIGDPFEDLGWLCVNSWRFGNSKKAVGGFGDRQCLFAAYEANGCRKVDPHAVNFWEVFGTLKWGIICLEQVFTHLKGTKRSIELIAIGRRVSETEIDLLNLIT